MRARMLGPTFVASLAALFAGCKGKPEDEPAPAASARAPAPASIDWAKCDTAIDKAARAPLAARPQLLIDGCAVCGGDWKPLLVWNVDVASGGPTPEQLQQHMEACEAFCTGDSKMKFLAAVDKARGGSVNTPWRQLSAACKQTVNIEPDDRFTSAPYFALDRIARKVSARGGDAATKLATLLLPLPAITFGGVGVVLPDAEHVTPKTGELQITVLGDAIHVGHMPRAKLGAAGVLADLRAGYPGEVVRIADLAGKLRALAGDDKTQTTMLLAPHAMPAEKLVPIIAATAAVAPIYLAAHAHESPEGWQLVGAIPVALEAGTGVEVTAEMTVQNLARELATRAARKEHRVGVTKK